MWRGGSGWPSGLKRSSEGNPALQFQPCKYLRLWPPSYCVQCPRRHWIVSPFVYIISSRKPLRLCCTYCTLYLASQHLYICTYIHGNKHLVSLGPTTHFKSLQPEAFYPPTRTRVHWGPMVHFQPSILGFFYATTCHVDCFILVIPSLNLVVSCPYVSYYLYKHTFNAF